MKKFVSFLFILALVFAAAFYAGQARKPSTISLSKSHSFQPAPYPLVSHPFVLVIIGQNNGAWLEKTLSSALCQNYAPFRIVYIDDGSTDGSFALAEELAGESELVTLVRNDESCGVLQSLASAVVSCGPQDIVVVLDGTDWLAHEWVLSRLNQYYANPNLWMTYGGSREYPSYLAGKTDEADPKLGLRSQPFFAGHLHSFYAGLFQQIAPEHLLYTAAVQQAYMFPMLEMAGSHVASIPDALYIVNTLAPKENLAAAGFAEKSIRQIAPYTALSKRPIVIEEEF
jgi:cellulose synthase/poly-beta-1,6-N-acetylglucosamine synthase-like glycosyltransferase